MNNTQYIELIKSGLAALNCDWAAREKLVDAVRHMEADIAELNSRRELDQSAKPAKQQPCAGSSS